MPAVRVFRVVKPGDPLRVDCDAFVVDQSMGSGRLYDTDFARSMVHHSPVPVILAGGLTPENVAGAIRDIRPYAVDVASGVEIRPGSRIPRKSARSSVPARGALP